MVKNMIFNYVLVLDINGQNYFTEYKKRVFGKKTRVFARKVRGNIAEYPYKAKNTIFNPF